MLYVASFYVKKEVMKHIVSSRFKSINFTALVCPGYISKYVASVAVKMYQRFYKEEDDLSEIRIFIEEKKAIEWLNSR